MPGLDDVLERLVNEPDFRDQLTTNPRTALEGYELSADDLDTLASQMSEGSGGLGSVEQRTTKAGLFGLFASMVGGGGGGAIIDDDTFEFDTDMADGGDGGPGGDGAEVSDVVLQEQPDPNEGGIVVQNDGGEGGIVIDNSVPSGDEGGIVVQNEGDEAGMIVDGVKGADGDEAGMIIDGVKGADGDEAGMIIDGGKGGDGSDALMFKEVDPAPAAPGDDQGFDVFEPEDGGGGPSDGEEVGRGVITLNEGDEQGMIIDGVKGGDGSDALMLKEVDPSPAAPSDDVGIELLGDDVEGPSAHM